MIGLFNQVPFVPFIPVLAIVLNNYLLMACEPNDWLIWAVIVVFGKFFMSETVICS